MSANQELVTREVYSREAATSNIIIMTALIPGEPALPLIVAEAVATMKLESITIDLGAVNRGSCRPAVPGRVAVINNGVMTIGYTNLTGHLSGQASQLYGQNIVNFFKLATPGEDGILTPDMDDDIMHVMIVTPHGIIMRPSPPARVPRARARKAVLPPPASTSIRTQEASPWVKPVPTAAAALIALPVYFAPRGASNHLIVLASTCVVDFYVITNVTHSLHTPLMSVANAISGIIVIGALIQTVNHDAWIQVLAFIAMVITSVNVFGGFAVTYRVLRMFQRS